MKFYIWKRTEYKEKCKNVNYISYSCNYCKNNCIGIIYGIVSKRNSDVVGKCVYHKNMCKRHKEIFEKNNIWTLLTLREIPKEELDKLNIKVKLKIFKNLFLYKKTFFI